MCVVFLSCAVSCSIAAHIAYTRPDRLCRIGSISSIHGHGRLPVPSSYPHQLHLWNTDQEPCYVYVDWRVERWHTCRHTWGERNVKFLHELPLPSIVIFNLHVTMIVMNWCPLLHIWFDWWTLKYQKCNWMKLCLLTWLPKTDVKKVHPLPSPFSWIVIQITVRRVRLSKKSASVAIGYLYLWQSVKTCCRCCQLQSSEPTKWISPLSPLFHWNPFQHDDDILFCRYVSAVQGCRLEIVKRRWGSASQIGFSAPPLQPPALKKPFQYSYSPHPLKTLLKPPENPPQTPTL